MEYGPRALGNRSILAAADCPDMPRRLNGRLGRSDFMPFAPVILEEYAGDWLDGWEQDHVAGRFMTVTYNIKPRKRALIPAVVHVDGTTRPQVLSKQCNPLLHRVITRYNQLIGIPLLINTSFNMHEEPIVCSPADAVDSFSGERPICCLSGNLRPLPEPVKIRCKRIFCRKTRRQFWTW